MQQESTALAAKRRYIYDSRCFDIKPKRRNRRVLRACEVCGRLFATSPSYISRIKTCSKECSRKLPTQRAKLRTIRIPEGVSDLTSASVVESKREIRFCSICQSPFAIYPLSPRRTCSAECESRLKSAGRRRLAWVTKFCLQCGKTFEITGRNRLRPNLFCSDACRLKGLNSLPRDPPQTRPCAGCGKPFRAGPKSKRKYCSRKCLWTDPDYRQRRAVRHSPTELELWLYRSLDQSGFAYERYKSVGRWNVDAFIPALNLIIEVDGWCWHKDRLQHDAQRDDDFRRAGHEVIHFTDRQLKNERNTKRLIFGFLREYRRDSALFPDQRLDSIPPDPSNPPQWIWDAVDALSRRAMAKITEAKQVIF